MENYTSQRSQMKKTGAVLCCLLAVMIFFSNTAYSFNQPAVTAVLPKNGKLDKTEKTSGITDWANKKDIYSQLMGTVSKVLVQDGDAATEGQELFHMEYDLDSINQKLRENAVAKKKILLEIESINIKMENIEESIRRLNGEHFTSEDVSSFDIEEAGRELEQFEKDYADAKILYEADAIPKSDLLSAEYALENAKRKLEKFQNQYDEAMKKNKESLEDKEKSREKQLISYNQELKDCSQQIKSRNLDYETLCLQDEIYQKQLSEFDQYQVIRAGADGTLYSVDVKEGQYISEHTLMASLGIGHELIIECDIPAGNNFIAAGDVCKLTNSSVKTEAVVSKITAKENAKEVRLSFESQVISAGETFDIEFNKTSDTSYTLIPNGALNMDKDGYFVYRILRRDGILGKEYYPSIQRVAIGDSDSGYTAITKGIDFFEPIVLLSDKSFEEKQAIKIRNERDFFDQ